MSNTTTPGNSFLPTHYHDPALDPANEHVHGHANHAIQPVSEPVYSSAHHPREMRSEFDPTPVSHDGAEHKGPYSGEKEYELGPSTSPDREGQAHHVRSKGWYSGYVLYWHILFFMLVTAWWIAGLILHNPSQKKHKKLNWTVPFLLWLFISLRLLTFHVSPQPVFNLIKLVWNKVFVATLDRTVPVQYRSYAGGALTVAVFIVGTMASKETADNSRSDRAISLFGLAVFVAVFYATSADRKRINWKTVQVGLIAQFIVALFVLRSSVGYNIFKFISDLAVDLLGFAAKGFLFLFADESNFPYFVVSVLPPVIFFISLVQVAYYYGLLQFFIVKFATFFYWAMDISGAEAVAAAAAPFIGQGENAILIRPFINHLTNAEIHQVMTSGFATIAGSVFGAYVALGANAQALLSATIMSIPASIAMSKIRQPETEETLTKGQVVIPESEDAALTVNGFQAFTNGAWLGLKVAGMISCILLCIISAVALIDGILGYIGKYIQVPQLTLDFLLGCKSVPSI